MKRNLLALLGVLLACGLASRYRDGEMPRLRQDMLTALERLWESTGHRVELSRRGTEVEAEVWLSTPAQNLTPRKEHWNHELLRFVAARHRPLRLSSLRIHGPNSRLLVENPGPAYARPDHRNTLLQRQLQTKLDHRYGPGQALALVDVGYWPDQGGRLKLIDDPYPETLYTRSEIVLAGWNAVDPRGLAQDPLQNVRVLRLGQESLQIK
ncbi:MAG: hypothetical protein U0931_11290 [Vulcanimicrobiota bacterium]